MRVRRGWKGKIVEDSHTKKLDSTGTLPHSTFPSDSLPSTSERELILFYRDAWISENRKEVPYGS